MSARFAIRNGVSVRQRLLALVFVPLLGCGAVAVTRLVSSSNSARAAGRAAEAISSAAAVAAVRAAFEQEIFPALSAAAVRDPVVFNGRRPPPAVVSAAANSVADQLPTLRVATDAALSRMADDTPEVEAASRFSLMLDEVRASIDQASVLSQALSEATTFLGSMAVVETALLESGTAAGLDVAGVAALRDVELVARAINTAVQEVGLYSATQLSSTGPHASHLQDWAEGWGAFAAASAAISNQAAPAVAASWNATNNNSHVRAVNTFLAAEVAPTGIISGSRVVGLIVEDGARNKAYSAVLATAYERALAIGRAQQHRAKVQLAEMIAFVIAIVAVSVIISVVVGRSITRPLQRLGAQATRISEGELADVDVEGPLEVRTVALALSGSVASLRNIEAYAAAVAAGDLTNSAIRTPLPGRLGEVVHSSAARIIGAINEREIAQLELVHRAAHDALTELPNRPQAIALIGQALHRAQRSSGETALMFVDLDYFKAVNDTFGHETGDDVLKTVAHRMLRTVREGDSVARLGGDEFVVLLEGIGADQAEVVRLANRLVDEISVDMTISGNVIRVGASIGIAVCRDGYVDADRLLREADAAAYRAKNGGRGRVDVFDDDLRNELTQRAEIERALGFGLDRGEFVLHYQPVVNLRTGATHSVEALIRWIRPGHGVVAPDEFIPVAERSTLINEIGRWALNEATDQLARWHLAGVARDQLGMAVNISGRHLSSHQLISDVSGALERSGIEARRLILEITETMLIDDPVATLNLKTLRAMGVRISIDDFGTGFTSIGQLPKLNVDSLKIDRSFVASEDPTQQGLVMLMVASAHAFGLSVVAEGIENLEQADRLRAAGAEYGQGYLFARPKPSATVFPLPVRRVRTLSKQPTT